MNWGSRETVHKNADSGKSYATITVCLEKPVLALYMYLILVQLLNYGKRGY